MAVPLVFIQFLLPAFGAVFCASSRNDIALRVVVGSFFSLALRRNVMQNMWRNDGIAVGPCFQFLLPASGVCRHVKHHLELGQQ